MKPALTPHQFVDTWVNVHLKESSAYVTHFDDLCELVGHPKPAHMDKTGATFTYQKGALKEQAGEIVGHGFADVWYKDHFAVEYKTARQLAESLQRSASGAGCDVEETHVDQSLQRESHVAAKRPSQVG